MIENNFFFRFDRSSFKAFYSAASELNFTRAAEKSGTTQSGISQHIAKLEAELETSLFLRNKGKLKLTDSGKQLRNYLERIFQEEEVFLENLNESTRALQGPVSYAMPGSCLMSPHFGMMLNEKLDEFPKVELSVQIEDSETVVEQVLKGDIDFGFITRDIEHPLIRKINFCDENYVLLTPPNYKLDKRNLLDQSFISHPDFNSLFSIWFKKQFPRKKQVTLNKLNYSGKTNRIPAALAMVSGGLGITVMPEHCAFDLIDDKKIRIASEFPPVSSTIYIITRSDISLSSRVKKVINTFLGFYSKKL